MGRLRKRIIGFGAGSGMCVAAFLCGLLTVSGLAVEWEDAGAGD